MIRKILITLAVFLAIIGIGIFLAARGKPAHAPLVEEDISAPPVSGETPESPIVVRTPKENDTIVSPVRLSGTVSGSDWPVFEGQAGTVDLLDSEGNVLTSGILTVSGNDKSTDFETVLSFSVSDEVPGTLVFRNENPSGLPEKEKEFRVLVILEESDDATSQPPEEEEKHSE